MDLTWGLGHLVEELDTSEIFVTTGRYSVAGDIHQIMLSFPRLRSLRTGFIDPLLEYFAEYPPLRHLSYGCRSPTSKDLDWVRRRKLPSLEIEFSNLVRAISKPLPRLESVRNLALCFKPPERFDWPEHLHEVWTRSLAEIVDSCSNITSLRLFDPNCPNYPHFLSLLSHPALLTSLALDCDDLASAYGIQCGPVLRRFTNLQYLDLCKGTISTFPSTYLSQLTKLTTLRLGLDAHILLRDEDLLNLVEGPTKLPALQHLVLDCFNGRMGRRVEPDEEVADVYSGLEEDGWKWPDFGNFTKGGLANFFRACRDSGVSVKRGGGDFDELQVESAYYLELANRTVLWCFQHRSLDGLVNGMSHFAHIPLETVDPQNLKLTIVDDPETKWFKLGLE